MRNILLVLILALFCVTIQAQTQLPLVPNVELPQGYETWQRESNTLVIREDLIFEMEVRGIETNFLVITCKMNSDLIHAMVLEPKETGITATLYWLSKEGYIKLSDKDKKMEDLSELSEQVVEAWKLWEQYVRKRYKINDEEMRKIKEFLL